MDRVVGTAAIVAMVLAVIAVRRRNWTRPPLLAVCAFAFVLVDSAFVESDDPSAIKGPAYVFYNALLVMAAATTLVITILEHDQQRK